MRRPFQETRKLRLKQDRALSKSPAPISLQHCCRRTKGRRRGCSEQQQAAERVLRRYAGALMPRESRPIVQERIPIGCALPQNSDLPRRLARILFSRPRRLLGKAGPFRYRNDATPPRTPNGLENAFAPRMPLLEPSPSFDRHSRAHCPESKTFLPQQSLRRDHPCVLRAPRFRLRPTHRRRVSRRTVVHRELRPDSRFHAEGDSGSRAALRFGGPAQLLSERCE